MNNKNIKYTIRLVMLILIISFISDKIVYAILNKISDQVYSGQSIGKLNHYLLVKDDLDFIVYGSSRANHHVNPQKISENSFNMGMDGKKIAFSATLIKSLPKTKEQVVFLHLDPKNAFAQDYDGSDLDALLVKYNSVEIFQDELDNLKRNKLIQKFYWCLGYNGKVLGIIKNYFKPQYNYKNYFGYDPIRPTETQKLIFQNILLEVKETHCESRLTLNSIYEKYIDELTVYCQKNNKTLLMFTSPVYEDKCNEDNEYLAKILKEKGITYYDWTNFFRVNNAQEYWKDRTHLSNIGAEIFSDSLQVIINSKLKNDYP